MMRYVAVGALVACLGLCGVLWWQSSTVSDLEAENSRLTRNVTALSMQADQSRLAADVAAARAARATQMTIEANATIEAIRNFNLGSAPMRRLILTLPLFLAAGMCQPKIEYVQ